MIVAGIAEKHIVIAASRYCETGVNLVLGSPQAFVAGADPVIAVVAVNGVVAIFPGHAVGAQAAADQVISVAAGDSIVPGVAENLIVPAQAINQVVSGVAVNGVGSIGGDDGVVACAAADAHAGELAGGFNIIAAFAAADLDLLHRSGFESFLLAVDLHDDVGLALRDID